MDIERDFETFEHYEQVIVSPKGELLTIPLRRGVSDTAFIDQITFRIHVDSLCLFAKQAFLISDESYIKVASEQLCQILGFGIAYKLNHSGGRFYDHCYQMGDQDVQYGRVHIGGQNNTLLVELTATGCMAAATGWEKRLYDFLIQCYGARITRIDLAKDFFNGEYSPEQAKQDRLDGLFTRHRAKMPVGESVGTDWESDTKKGKTYYVGSRESSRYVRVYEKGKQLGDENSIWTRFEVEMKARDIVIPFDSLLYPGEYFGGAYPICEKFSKLSVTKQVDSASKVFEITLEKGVEFIKRQCGKWLVAIEESFKGKKTKEQIYEMLSDDEGRLPKRLKSHRFAAEFYDSSNDIHQFDYEQEKDFIIDDYGYMPKVSIDENLFSVIEAKNQIRLDAYRLINEIQTASETEKEFLKDIIDLADEDIDECERVYGKDWMRHFGDNAYKFFQYFL